MKALDGVPAELAQRILEAGADIVLHCNGKIVEMEQIAAVLPAIRSESLERWAYAKAMLKSPDATYNPAQDAADLDILLGGLAYDEKSIG